MRHGSLLGQLTQHVLFHFVLRVSNKQTAHHLATLSDVLSYSRKGPSHCGSGITNHRWRLWRLGGGLYTLPWGRSLLPKRARGSLYNSNLHMSQSKGI